ncbi:MAG: hypothetical protein WC028_30340 [Candidatus Obscuribacterales bacterium]|jgi:hypothetical protein
MKITDTIGRTVDIALVAKPAANARFGADVDWLRPIFHQVTDSSKLFVRMPEGPFAIRVMSKHATQMLVHVSGKLVLRTDVASGLQYIKKDGSGSNFVFGVNADDNQNASPNVISDADQIAALSAPKADVSANESADVQPSLLDGIVDGASDDGYIQLPLLADASPDSVFIVVRFVDDEGPGLKPPAQEFEVCFQMNKPVDHDELVATRNLLTMVRPARLIDEQDETSFEPPQTHRPTFHCTCTGCTRGAN